MSVGATQSGLPYMAFLASYAIFMCIAGGFIDKYSPSLVIIMGGFLVGSGWILSGFATNINMLTITYGFIAGGGVGIIYGVPIAVVTRWFPDRKGLAVGLTLLGFGLSPFITAPISRWLIDLYGPMHTFKILGIIFFIVITALAIPFRFPRGNVLNIRKSIIKNKRQPREFTPNEMLRSAKFYGLWLCYAIGTMVGLLAIGITSPVGEEVIKLDSHQAALMVSIFAIFNGIGRPLFGWLTDKLNPLKTAVISYIIIIASASLMMIAKEGTVFLYMLSFAMLWLILGGWLAIAPTATAIYFGMENNSRNYGFVFTAYGAGAVVGVVLSGMIRDSLGSYIYVFYPMILLALLGIFIAAVFLNTNYKFTTKFAKIK